MNEQKTECLSSNLNVHFTSEDVPCWISLEEAAVIFHVNPKALYSGVNNTTLPCKRMNDRALVSPTDVEHFIAVHV